MTLTNSTKLQSGEYQSDFSEAAAAETVAEAAEALALEGSTPAVSGDWAYSATAEGRTGEVAVTGPGSVSIDVDGEPGIIYTGPAGGAVRVQMKGLDILEGTIAPEAADSYAVALLVNNTIVDFSDEGVTAVGTGETVVEHNVDTYVGNLQNLDVIRVAVVGLGEETVDLDVAVGGSLNIV